MIEFRCDVCKRHFNRIEDVINLEATYLTNGYSISNYQICENCHKQLFGELSKLDSRDLNRCLDKMEVEDENPYRKGY